MAKSKKVKTENYTGVFTIKEQKLPYRCPICGGNGIVPDGFYTQTSGNWSSSGTTEKCRSCENGIVWN